MSWCTKLAFLASKNDKLLKLANEDITKMDGMLNTAAMTYIGAKMTKKSQKANTIPLRNITFTKTQGPPRTRKVPGRRQNYYSNCKKSGHNESTCHLKGHQYIDSKDPFNSYFSLDDASIDLGVNFDDP